MLLSWMWPFPHCSYISPIQIERMSAVFYTGISRNVHPGFIFIFSSWMMSIREMVDFIQERVNQLTKQRPAHKEFASQKDNLTVSLDDYLKKVRERMNLH